MSFADIVAYAIRFARDGFPTYPFFTEIIAAKKGRFATGRRPPRIPARRTSPAHGGKLQADRSGAQPGIHRDQERAHAGNGRLDGLRAAHDAFYRGDLAAAIVRHQQDNGGLLAAEDLASFQASFEPPCRTRFAGFDVYGCGAWSQGPMVLEALNILERLDLKAIGHNSPAYIHAVTEALKLAAADRETYFGDPNFVDVPLDVLLSKSYAAERHALFDPARAWPGMPPAGQATITPPAPGSPIRPLCKRRRDRPQPQTSRREKSWRQLRRSYALPI